MLCAFNRSLSSKELEVAQGLPVLDEMVSRAVETVRINETILQVKKIKVDTLYFCPKHKSVYFFVALPSAPMLGWIIVKPHGDCFFGSGTITYVFVRHGSLIVCEYVEGISPNFANQK